MIKLWPVWAAVIMHIIWGIILICDKSAGESTFTYKLINWLNCSVLCFGIILIVIGLLAGTGLILNGRKPIMSTIMIVPQIGFLVLHSGFALIAIFYDDVTPSGYKVDIGLYLLAYTPLILLTILHTWTILWYHRELHHK